MPTPKRAVGLELFEKKKVKVGDNTIKLHGIGLDLPAATDLLINMQLPGYLWFVKAGTIASTAGSITFEAKLVATATKIKPVNGDTGDLTITLMYTDDNDPIEIICQDIEIQ